MVFPSLLIAFLCATASAYALTWIARTVAPYLGYVDRPDGGRKRHGKATPLLGGVAVYGAFSVTLAAVLMFLVPEWRQDTSIDLALLVASGGLFCLLGLWDDKRPLRARDKFLLQILASLPFAIWGPQVETVSVAGFHFTLGPWALIFSVFWLVSCANVVNLVDGLDGLASSVGFIAISTLAIVSFGGRPPIVSLVALTFAGSIAGFLIHNWPPAKIFLGDAGSLTIGFMVGAVAIESSNKTTAGFMLVFPLALLSVPIFDTSMAILRRKLTGRGIGEADRGHIHHRLQDRGLTKLQTLLAIVGICSTMAGACLLASVYRQDLVAVVMCAGVLALIIAGRIFGFHEMMLVFRHFEIFHSTISEAARDLKVRRMVVHLEHSESLSIDALWDTVVSKLESVGGSSLDLRCTTESDNDDILFRKWQASHPSSGLTRDWQFQYTIVREDGLCASFAAAGFKRPGETREGLDQLVQVFEAFCRYLPDIEEVRNEDQSARVHTLPTAASDELVQTRRAA
ncbi:MAG: undecaprenyl/decaprenyl-phosphate alpha-N-acetylglucosaminyl 1-phosphate transferase [Planctomycetaceae bacterium]|nr:undecaprenyl/decaprenyl-phosphate alpha-N-acetylglucosaminyl 1-phosphate transferase [Planctomycetales bacterium]MCB9920700.1 undecaprenyl/decaprenyl-phosphate alpha-N-acetylglucosaminyl 1-phosphate transferase [Planctomycetaceae bacterium]